VLVGLPPGGRHELGVLAFAVAARRAGLDVAYLGADLPVASWIDAVDIADAAALVLAVPRVEDAEPADATVRTVVEHRPGTAVYVGGAGQELVGPPADPLGHQIGAAARELAERLRRAGR
jgi:methanogenic corrinoid protein MtbC1